jgi:hypothetical protein
MTCLLKRWGTDGMKVLVDLAPLHHQVAQSMTCLLKRWGTDGMMIIIFNRHTDGKSFLVYQSQVTMTTVESTRSLSHPLRGKGIKKMTATPTSMWRLTPLAMN